jgi:hypothetical protein
VLKNTEKSNKKEKIVAGAVVGGMFIEDVIY